MEETVNDLPERFRDAIFQEFLAVCGFCFSFILLKTESLWVAHIGLELCGPD